MSLPLRLALASTLACALLMGVLAAPASAFNPVKALCGVAKVATLGRANPCGAVKTVGRVLNAGKKLLTGHPGAAAKALVGSASPTSAALALGAVVAWVLAGAKVALHETAHVLSATTTPQLRSTWFSGTYWRMAGIAAVLTLPFLFSAALQALVRGDLGLLARAAFMHLPLAILAVSIAAPLTMLVLAASDELSAIVSSAAGHQSVHFLSASSLAIGGLTALSSPFLAFLIGVFTVTATLALWLELLVRQTAVYVIVLMLPLTFAAFVWPARRIWAVRTLELLFALILAKFAIVAVLSLGGAALNSSVGTHGIVNWLAGLVLVVMAAFMPWALLRLVPLAEVASGAAGALRHEMGILRRAGSSSANAARAGDDWVASVSAHMRRQAQDVRPPSGHPEDAGAGATAEGAGGVPGADRGVPGADRGVPGADRGVPGADRGVPGADGGVAGADGGVPGGAGGVAGAAGETPAAGSPARPREPGGAPTQDAGATNGDRPAEWESDLMDAKPMTRVIRHGGVDENGRPHPPAVGSDRTTEPPAADPFDGTSMPARSDAATAGVPTAGTPAAGATAAAGTPATGATDAPVPAPRNDPDPLPPAQPRPEGTV